MSVVGREMLKKLQNPLKSFEIVRPALLVSTPHPLSNIRFLKLQRGTREDQNWIEFRQNQVHQHHLFWAKNNVEFQTKKEAFIASFDKKVTPEQLSLFYKQYLEENHEKMVEYNKNLWKESVLSLGPGIRYELLILKRWIHFHGQHIQERIRMYIMMWFTAGLTTPLLFLK
jgi:hypothetical protein